MHMQIILDQCVACDVALVLATKLRQLSEELEKKNLHTMEALKIAEEDLEVVKEKSKGDN